jgi:hypothetical protein
VTKKYAYPLPQIEYLLEQLAGYKYYSTIDLFAGYWQIPMEESAVAKTAFVCREGIYEFLVIPFGLINAPATLQQIMDGDFIDYTNEFLFVYLDDIFIYSKTFEEHCVHL